ncbi:MAG: nitric-oxide reductase large subunit, partial [Chloroflexota bacterium]
MLSGSARRELIVSRVWIQTSVLVMLFGFGVMGILAYGANDGAPPVPQRIVDSGGAALFTAADIVGGQEIFLRNGLMEYGSIFGHGAYLGPDYTADALRRGALDVLEQYGGPASDQALARTIADFKTNTYQASTGTLVFSAAQVHAYQTLRDHYQAFFANPSAENGLRPSAIVDPEQIRQLTSFFTWSAWASAAQRPGQTYSYT